MSKQTPPHPSSPGRDEPDATSATGAKDTDPSGRGAAGAGTPWLTDAEQRAWRAYLRGGRMLEEALDRDLRDHGLQLTEYEIISMLSESVGNRLRMSELAEIVVQSRSRLTHTATRLEKLGWVTRQPYEGDRRGVELVLTDSGRARVLEVSESHVRSVRRHLVGVMSPEQFAGLGAAMTAVLESAVADSAYSPGSGGSASDDAAGV